MACGMHPKLGMSKTTVARIEFLPYGAMVEFQD